MQIFIFRSKKTCPIYDMEINNQKRLNELKSDL